MAALGLPPPKVFRSAPEPCAYVAIMGDSAPVLRVDHPSLLVDALMQVLVGTQGANAVESAVHDNNLHEEKKSGGVNTRFQPLYFNPADFSGAVKTFLSDGSIPEGSQFMLHAIATCTRMR